MFIRAGAKTLVSKCSRVYDAYLTFLTEMERLARNCYQGITTRIHGANLDLEDIS
jgi:hypothetical protein